MHNTAHADQVLFDDCLQRSSLSSASTLSLTPEEPRARLSEHDRESPSFAPETDFRNGVEHSVTKASILEAVHTVIGELGLDHALAQAVAPGVSPHAALSSAAGSHNTAVQLFMPKPQHQQNDPYSSQQILPQGYVQDRRPCFEEQAPPAQHAFVSEDQGSSLPSIGRNTGTGTMPESCSSVDLANLYQSNTSAEHQHGSHVFENPASCSGSPSDPGMMLLPASSLRNMFVMSQMRQPHGVPVSPMSPASRPAMKDETFLSDMGVSSGEAFPPSFSVHQQSDQFHMPNDRGDRTVEGEEFELAASSVFGLGSELDF